MTRVRAAGAIAAAVAAAVLLAGCTGIPSSSAPQTVQPLERQVGQRRRRLAAAGR